MGSDSLAIALPFKPFGNIKGPSTTKRKQCVDDQSAADIAGLVINNPSVRKSTPLGVAAKGPHAVACIPSEGTSKPRVKEKEPPL